MNAATATATFVVPELDESTTIVFELTVTAGDAQDIDQVSVILTPAADEDDDATPDDDAAAGATAYADNGCAVCHADDASGASGPALIGDQTAGLETRFGSGAAHFGSTLTEEEISAIAAWLAGLADGDGETPPGGPCEAGDAGAGEASIFRRHVRDVSRNGRHGRIGPVTGGW